MISSLGSLTGTSKEIRILPAGVFRANDGRPVGLAGWRIDAAIAASIASDLATRDELVIDYDHQSLLKKENGQPAPAAGWFSQVVWREGEGLFAVNIKWTDKARQMIAAREYRYVSPVFVFDDQTGDIQRLVGLALTNTPALTSLVDLGGLSVNSRKPASTPRESDRGIEAFNRAFGPAGVFHPDTPPEALAQLNGNVPKPLIPATMTESEAAVMHQSFPGVFAGK